MNVRSYRDLVGWQRAMEQVSHAYRLARAFPDREVFGLTSQFQRAAVSVAANIAEGHARDSTKDFLRHLSIASGSLAEFETLVTVAKGLSYIAPPEHDVLIQRSEEISRMIRGLQKQLRRRVSGSSSPPHPSPLTPRP